MAEVNWTKQAIQDINKIAEFIAKDSDHYAKIQVQRFFNAVKALEKQPKPGKVVPEKQDPLIREILLGNYRIIYKIISEVNMIFSQFTIANDYFPVIKA